jgi:hypothetical protein
MGVMRDMKDEGDIRTAREREDGDLIDREWTLLCGRIYKHFVRRHTRGEDTWIDSDLFLFGKPPRPELAVRKYPIITLPCLSPPIDSSSDSSSFSCDGGCVSKEGVILV